jgi:hypothetical protein
MDLWMKIGSALLVLAMIIYVWPRVRVMMQESREAQPGDWQSALIPLALVLAFVAFLMWLV